MLADPEFDQRFKGRFFGKYRGIVTSVDDPKKYGRIKVKVPAVLDDAETGWAWPMPMYGGGINTGGFFLPEQEDLVWIEFEEGDKNRPIWMHGPWGKRGGDNNVNAHARGEADDEDLGYHGVGPTPPSQFAGTYGNVRYLRDPAGNRLEMDATPGAERLLLRHPSGAGIEITPDGSLTLTGAGNRAEYVVGNRRVGVLGKDLVESQGSERVVYGDAADDIRGKLDVIVLDGVTYNVRQLDYTVKGDETRTLGGSLYLAVGANKTEQVIGSRASMVSKNDLLTVMENAEWFVTNSLNLDPTATSLLIHGYNGLTRLRATDITGAATLAQVKLDPGVVPGMRLYVGTPADEAVGSVGAYVEMNQAMTTISNPLLVLLGGSTAIEPGVLGTALITFLTTIMTMLDTHIHPTGVGPSGPPAAPLFSSTLASSSATLISTKVFLE